MLRPIRLTVSRIPVGSRVWIRTFSLTPALHAKAKDDAKVKPKPAAYKPKAKAQVKVKKGGMTHLGFKDAIRSLGYEKLAMSNSELGLQSLTSESPAGTVVNYEPSSEKKLATLKSFKKYQYHELSSNPVSLVTSNTVNIRDNFVNKLQNSSSKDNRLCIQGETGSGKSTLVTQASALALSNDVILLHLDHAEKLVNGTSDYIFSKKLNKYQQPMFTRRWINDIRSANEEILKKLPLSKDISFTNKKVDYNLKAGTNTLFDFLSNANESGFQFFVEELVHHSATVPVLLSVDNINAFTGKSLTRYFHPDFTPIHFTEFEVGQFILDAISGKISFQKGGVLLSESGDAPSSKTLPVGLNLLEYDPYWKQAECDIDVANSFLANGGVKSYKVEAFTKSETRSLLSYYRQSGALQIRDYPTNVERKTAEQIISEKKLGEKAKIEHIFDPEQHFEKLVNNTFMMSCGNPKSVVHSTCMPI